LLGEVLFGDVVGQQERTFVAILIGRQGHDGGAVPSVHLAFAVGARFVAANLVAGESSLNGFDRCR
jgi:hypothetical protein